MKLAQISLCLMVLALIAGSAQAFAQSPDVIINEICNDPGNGRYSSKEPEYIELYNTTAIPIDLSGWEVRDNSGNYTIPNGTIITGNGYKVISFETQYFKDHYGFDPQQYGVLDASAPSISLSNSGDLVALLDSTGTLIDYVAFRSGWMNGSAPSGSTLSGTNGLPAYTGTLAPTSGGNAQDLCTTRIPNGVDGDATPGNPATEDAAASFHSGPFTPGWDNSLPTVEIHDDLLRNPDEIICERSASNYKRFFYQLPSDTGLNISGIRVWGRYWDANAAMDVTYTYNTAESTYSSLQDSGLVLPQNESGFTDAAPEHSLRYQGYFSGRLSPIGGTIVIDIEVAIPALSISETYQFELTVVGPSGPLQITTMSPLPAATEDALYSQSLTATGGTEPYTWSLMTGAPSWLSINASNGNVTGTPPVGEAALSPINFTAVVTDSTSTDAMASFNVSVFEALQITTIGLPNVQIGVQYDRTLQASGGSGSYTFSLVGTQTLPIGLSMSAQGQITGNAACGTAGTSSYTFQVEDSQGLTATKAMNLTVDAGTCAPLTISSNQSLPGGTQFTLYQFQFAANGGTAPYSWAFTTPASAPSWLMVNATTGWLSGTAGQGESGLVSFGVTVTDDNAITSQRTFFLNIDEAEIIISTASQLPQAEEDVPYSATLSASGGQPQLIWSFSGLPAWLTFSGTNKTLTGTPPLYTTGNQPEAYFSFIGRVTDGGGQVLARTFRITVLTGPRPPKRGDGGSSGLCSLNQGDGSSAWLVLVLLGGVALLRKRERVQ